MLTLAVAVCEDNDRRVIFMLSMCFALNKMHYSVLPRHLHYSILMSCYCCVMFDLALALVLVLGLEHLSLGLGLACLGLGLELLSLESKPANMSLDIYTLFAFGPGY